MGENNKKVCFECGDKYTGVRLDQRFCKQQCRNRYNNRRYREAAKATKTIDAKLHKNYQILQRFGEGVYSIKRLQSHGYNFKHYTNTGRSTDKTMQFHVYDMAYSVSLNRENIIIFKPQTTT